jgi:integrase
MPYNNSKRTAGGAGTIRKKTFVSNGKEYTYWEARYTSGYDPGTGKQIQRTINGKSKKEVAEKLREATASIDKGTYLDPCKMTLGEWLDIWAKEYLIGVKESTAYTYKTSIKNHIKPAMGAVRLDAVTPHMIQGFYNSKLETHSAKTIKNFHGVLHAALKQAVLNGYIATNPADASIRPRVEKKEMHPMDEYLITDFLEAIRGEQFEHLFFVTLFTGMRKGEVLGLTWDAVDFSRGTILIDKQLQRPREGDGKCILVTTKNGKSRKLKPAREVMNVLYRTKKQQMAWQLEHGECFQNPMNLVFTNEFGGYLNPNTVYNHFKEVVAQIGAPDIRFHDMRHSYAVAALQAGDDVKTVQGNLGHATAAFTLDVYGHVTDQMKEESANRMERFIHSVRTA